jgi:hypothetical protein
MSLLTSKFGGVGLLLIFAGAGCGIVHTHPDCDQIAQQQRTGASDEEVAKGTGYSIVDVQSCSETQSSAARETANNFQDRPQLPVLIPNIPGSIGGSFR